MYEVTYLTSVSSCLSLLEGTGSETV